MRRDHEACVEHVAHATDDRLVRGRDPRERRSQRVVDVRCTSERVQRRVDPCRVVRLHRAIERVAVIEQIRVRQDRVVDLPELRGRDQHHRVGTPPTLRREEGVEVHLDVAVHARVADQQAASREVVADHHLRVRRRGRRGGEHEGEAGVHERLGRLHREIELAHPVPARLRPRALTMGRRAREADRRCELEVIDGVAEVRGDLRERSRRAGLVVLSDVRDFAQLDALG